MILMVIILYLIIIILQYYVLKNLNNINDYNLTNQIKYNKKNSIFLHKTFNQIISDRLYLLKTKYKNDYNGWLEYNRKNEIIHLKYDYYISIIEKIGDTDNYLFKVFPDKSYLNLTLDNIININSNYTYFTHYNIDKNLFQNMYENNSTDNVMKYIWVKPIDNILVEKIGIFKKFETNDGKNKGIILTGYMYNDINTSESYFYFDQINKYILILSSLFIFILSLTIYYVSKSIINKCKALLFLIYSNIFIIYFISNKEQIGTIQIEVDKQKSLNDSLLAVSFLFAVNIFIIRTLYKNDKKYIIYLESSILFIASLLLILFTIFKDNNFTDIYILIKKRIQKQYFFNFAILINIFILINYIIFVLTNN